MKLFRNREIRQFTLIYCLLCLPFVIGGFYLSRPAGILLLGLALCLYGLWFLDASRRYRGMERLAHQLDQILHSHTAASLSKYQEGELSLLENEINKLLTRLWEQTDLQEKDKRYLADSMADISHQLRTGLTTIHLALSSLGEDDLPASRQLGYRREISRQLSRMDWLVSALLKLSKLDAGTIQFHPVPVSFADLVGRGTEPLQIPMELKGQALVTDLSGSVFCDPAWTGEAIGNILKNCTEHMGEGTLFVTSAENPLYAQLIIRDTGPGIDPEDLPNLFRRFYRGKNAGPDSVGIGLALSRAILSAQNGTIKVRNAPQGGAEFTIRFYKGTV